MNDAEEQARSDCPYPQHRWKQVERESDHEREGKKAQSFCQKQGPIIDGHMTDHVYFGVVEDDVARFGNHGKSGDKHCEAEQDHAVAEYIDLHRYVRDAYNEAHENVDAREKQNRLVADHGLGFSKAQGAALAPEVLL